MRILLLFTLMGCGSPLILSYNYRVEQTSVRQINMFTFRKGYLVQAYQTDYGFETREYDILWYGDSVRSASGTWKLDTTATCLRLTGKTTSVTYCK